MSNKMKLKISHDDKDVGYLKFPGYKKNYVEKTLRLNDLIDSYDGPDLYFDFDTNGRLIGIEILL